VFLFVLGPAGLEFDIWILQRTYNLSCWVTVKMLSPLSNHYYFVWQTSQRMASPGLFAKFCCLPFLVALTVVLYSFCYTLWEATNLMIVVHCFVCMAVTCRMFKHRPPIPFFLRCFEMWYTFWASGFLVLVQKKDHSSNWCGVWCPILQRIWSVPLQTELQYLSYQVVTAHYRIRWACRDRMHFALKELSLKRYFLL
jgi:hypothetical protein